MPEIPDDLAPEQAVVAAILARDVGWDRAVELVRDARFEAYAAGSHLVPVLTDLAEKMNELVTAYERIVEGDS